MTLRDKDKQTNKQRGSTCGGMDTRVSQSMTLCTELCASPNISKALPCTLMHCVMDSADCTITILPPASMPPHVLLLVYLFICLPLSLMHVLPSLFVYFPFLLFLILTSSGPMLGLAVPIV